MGRTKNAKSNALDDKAFFLRFYEENKGFLFYTAQKYTDDPGDCEDIVQESILRLLKNVSTLRSLERNQAFKYIALTVRSAFLDHQRKKHTAQMLTADDGMLEALFREEQPDSPLSAYLEVMALKQSLPPRDWMVLEGRYILGYSYEELSEQLGLTQENIRMIVSRAKEKARKLLLSDSEEGGNTNAG